ncbi:hypothetical protein QC762_001335 [Podospora pseudocomata]|uniref:Secreted protein n=1 Tax=Podospora pseudocomata TaxID=2093779 RepID=A0ABR0G228_9PEZI|nr:hypothetical protein QC762_001335 [Podospora pseudocomata]
MTPSAQYFASGFSPVLVHFLSFLFALPHTSTSCRTRYITTYLKNIPPHAGHRPETMRALSILTLTTVALAASVPDFRQDSEHISGSQRRRSAEPGNIQLHKTVIPDWADDIYLTPSPKEHLDSERLLLHQSNVKDISKERDSPSIRVDPVEVHMYTETYPSPGVERNVVSARGTVFEPEPNSLGGRVPTCTRKAGKLHTQRKWSIGYDHDNKYNGMHCGQSVRVALKSFKKCRPTTDWTCVRNGEQGLGGVTVEFHTPRGCDDRRIHQAMKKASGGQIDVWCQHK